MKLWLFFLPCTCVTSYAGIVYQSECQIMDTRTTPESVVLSVTGGQSCSAYYGGTRDWPAASAGTLGRGTLPSIDVQAYASPGGEPVILGEDVGPYVSSADISVEASDRILVFGADVAAAHLVIRSLGDPGLDTYGFFDASFRFNGTPLSLHIFPPVGGESFTLAAGRAFELEASLIASAHASRSLIGSSIGRAILSIDSIELLDANGQSLSGYTWASQSGWNYNFIGGQQVFTPEPVSTLPIGALLLIAYEAIRRHRAARRSVI